MEGGRGPAGSGRDTDERLARLLQPGPRHALLVGRDRRMGAASDQSDDLGFAPDDRPTLEQPLPGRAPPELPGEVAARTGRRRPGSGDRNPPEPESAASVGPAGAGEPVDPVDPVEPGVSVVAAAAADSAPTTGAARSRLAGLRFAGPQLAVIAVIAVLAVGLATWAVLRARPVAIASPESTAAARPSATVVGAPAPPEEPEPTPSTAPITVHVVGAVRRPGVLDLAPGARVDDAVRAAGGLTGKARLGTLNLAQPVADGQQVFVAGAAAAGRGEQSEVRDPGEAAGGAAPPAGTSSSGTDPAELIDLNAATATELEELPGVGPVTAEAILSWREENGSFSAIEELQEVDGIGPKTYEDLAPLVTV